MELQNPCESAFYQSFREHQAKALGLYYLQPPDGAAGNEPPCVACVIRRGMDELL